MATFFVWLAGPQAQDGDPGYAEIENARYSGGQLVTDLRVDWNRAPGGSRSLILSGVFGPSAVEFLFYGIARTDTGRDIQIRAGTNLVINGAGFAKANDSVTLYTTTLQGDDVSGGVYTHPACP